MTKDYSQGKIYKIQCNITGDVYVGSTTKKYLSQRLTKHVGNYRNYKKGGSSSYISSYEIIKRGHYKIILLEVFPCSSSDELRAREQHYIDTLECVNKHSAFRSEEDKKEYKGQYHVENRDKHLERMKANYEENKGHYNTQSKKWYEENKDHALNKKKQLYKENKEEILAKMREYNQTHKNERKERDDKRRDNIRSYANTKIKCECGKEVSRSNLASHRKSRNHTT